MINREVLEEMRPPGARGVSAGTTDPIQQRVVDKLQERKQITFLSVFPVFVSRLSW